MGFLGSTLCRLSAAILILTAGCSASGIFSARGAKGRNAISEAFASTDDASDSRDRPTASAARPGAVTGSALDPVQRRKKVGLHLAAAARAEKAGDLRSARREYERVLALEPSHSLANYQLAVIADNESRFDDAERHYQALLRKTPQNPDLLASLGWSYLLQGRYDESERTLRDALSIEPQHRTAQYNLGWLYGTLGDYDRSLEVFRAAGSEADAQHAIAELFPRGRPADGPSTAATTPRNPFRPTARDVSSGNRSGGARGQDRLAPGTVSAPAPWQKQSDLASVDGTPVRATSSTADRRKGDRDDRHFDEVFSSLEMPPGSTNNRDSLPAGEPGPPSAQTADFRDPSSSRARGIQTAAFDQTRAAPPADAPIITPRSGTPPRTDPRSSSIEIPPSESERVASLPSGGPPRGAGPQGRSLPDWPYPAPGARRGEGRSAHPPAPRPDARTSAILLGLSAGPGGLLFPATTPDSAEERGHP